MNLYEIESEVLKCIDEETGEIIDIEKLSALELERDTKIENILLWIKNLKSEAEALKAEKEAFAQRQKAAENKMESLKRYISGYLGGMAFQTARVKASFRKSEAVEIADGATIPEEYLKFKEPEVNKTELKKALKSGLVLEGVCIRENQNIQIK